jgi:hypothetical protein
MAESTEREQQAATAVDIPSGLAPAAEPAATVAKVKAMFAMGHGTPAAVAEVLRAHPADRDAVLAFLHRTVGNSYVQTVVKVLAATHEDDEPEMTVTDKRTKLAYADGNVHAKRTRTETTTEGENKQVDERSTDISIGKGGVGVDHVHSREDANSEDAATKVVHGYGGSIGPSGVAVHGKHETEAKLGDIKHTKGHDATGSLALDGTFEGEAARATKRETEHGSHEAKQSVGLNKEHQLELGASKTDEVVTTAPDGSPQKASTSTNAKARLGLDGVGGDVGSTRVTNAGTKTAATAGFDVGKDGLSAHAGYSVSTASGRSVATSVSHGTKVTANAPVAVGDHFEVAYVRTTTTSGTASGGATAGGIGGSIGGGASESTFESGVRTFETQKEAEEFHEEAAEHLAGTPAFARPGTVAGALTMPIGDTRGSGQASGLSANGSLSFEGASIGGGVHESSAHELDVKRVGAMVFDVTTTASGEKGAELAISGGLTDTKSRSKSEYWAVTYRFDLSGDAGRAGFEAYCRDRVPNAAGKLMGIEHGNHADTRDHIKVAGLGDAEWKSQTDEKHRSDAGGTHDEYKGGQSHDQDPSWLARNVTGDKAEHSSAELTARLENGKEAGYTATVHVAGDSGAYNREMLGKMSVDPTQEGPAKASGEWTLTADISTKTIHDLERDVSAFRGMKTQDDKMRMLTELMSHNAQMVRGKAAFDVELKGDPNFPGRAGRELTEATLAQLVHQITETPASAASVVGAAQHHIDALTERRKAVADHARYTDLPDGLRAEQLQQIDKELAGFTGVRHRALQESVKNKPGESIDAIRVREADPHAFANLGPEDKAVAHLRDQIADTDAKITTFYKDNGEASIAVDHVFHAHAFRSAHPGPDYAAAKEAADRADAKDTEQAAGNAAIESMRLELFTATGAARIGRGHTLLAMLETKRRIAEDMYKALVESAIHLSRIMTKGGVKGHEAFWSQFPLDADNDDG